MSIRIIAGKYRGRGLEVSAGRGIRPTLSRVREAMFNILAHHRMLDRLNHPGLANARVADLCCGSGALGFEALSRGAAFVTFVDQSRATLALVERNAAKLGATNYACVQSHAAQLPYGGQGHDIILLDPPYGKNLAPAILASLAAQGWLNPLAAIMLETGAREEPSLPPGFTAVDKRIYGAAALHLIVTGEHNI